MFSSSIKMLSRVYVPVIAVASVFFAGNAWGAEYSQKRATPVPDGDRAEIILNVPLDGIVYIDGRRTSGTGTTRRFVTPPLAPERKYYYDVKVSWVEGSQARENSRHVAFRAGDRIVLNYSQPNGRETRWDLYFDPSAPNPTGSKMYQDPLIYPYFLNSAYVSPFYRLYPR